MNYIQEYKRFVNSYHFNNAIRITIGVALPAIVLGYFKLLPVGLLLSLGAIATSTADITGPIQRRVTAMLITTLLNFVISIIVGYSHKHIFLLGVIIALLCFFLSIISIYGNRVSAIGLAGLIIMVLTMNNTARGWNVLWQSLYIMLGGVWYMLLGLALFRMRPYRLVQQALGDSIIAIGDYLKTRSYFYDKNVDYEKTYKNLMLQQEAVHDKQEQLREMIFKSRAITSQSTVTGRTLLIIFIESIDLFEKATTTIYNYESMHRRFDETGILPLFQNMILEMVSELHATGLAVQSGRPAGVSENLNNKLKALKTDFEKFIHTHRRPENIAPLVHMRKIMQAIEDMVIRIYTLRHYTGYDKKRVKHYKLSDNYDSFVTPSSIDFQLLKENLSFRSNNFLHALRVTIATTLGYAISILLHLEFSYWVLLTILVILKPSYSLTKKRNYHRLLGTIIGVLVGIGLLFLIASPEGRVAVMILFILASYSFIGTNYFIGVVFMTSYVIMFFYIINSNNFVSVIENRVIDTAIGSAIAFLSTYILVPSWEKAQIKNYMQMALEKSALYFKKVAESFVSGRLEEMQYRFVRKEAFIAQSNLSGAFNRMMNEPKSKQDNIKKIHQFTVLIYTLNSHVAALADFAQNFAAKYQNVDLKGISGDIVLELSEARNNIADEEFEKEKKKNNSVLLKEEMREIVEKRRQELQNNLIETETRTLLIEYKPIIDQFLFISRIAADIRKSVGEFE